MRSGYSSQKDYMKSVKRNADVRQKTIEEALRDAFSGFIESRDVEVVVFGSMSVMDIAGAILNRPVILKALLACCNVAARAIERDLGIKNLDTYSPHLDKQRAGAIAAYIKPFLPSYVEVPALSRIDRIAYIDKEIRKTKGQWEIRVRDSLNRHGKRRFDKRTFEIVSASRLTRNIAKWPWRGCTKMLTRFSVNSGLKW